jgi:hypothetical protein
MHVLNILYRTSCAIIRLVTCACLVNENDIGVNVMLAQICSIPDARGPMCECS